MQSMEQLVGEIDACLSRQALDEAEEIIDQYADREVADLAEFWALGEFQTRDALSVFYNHIGIAHRRHGLAALQRDDSVNGLASMRAAHRCHEKALDMYDISPDDFMLYPVGSPIDKNLLCTFWGLGTTKFVLDQVAEARKYLLLCVRFQSVDAQTERWQVEAVHYLRHLEG